jgi:hypothetical protein
MSAEDAIASIKKSREPAAAYLDADRQKWAEELVKLAQLQAPASEASAPTSTAL